MIENCRVLIVEDDAALADLAMFQLRGFNCDVSCAKSGEEALKMVVDASTPPDVVIMDVRLPGGMDGVECARRIKHDHRETMIIFMTGACEPSVLERARSVFPTAFILKDIGTPSANSLRAAVRLALDQREGMRRTTQLESANIHLRHLTMLDELTRLYNRRGFTTLGPRYLEPGRQAILFIDLDNLKAINDTLGHEAGDDALRRFAKILKSVFREDDLLARLGGDEFAVLAGVGGDEKLAAVKQRLQQALAIANLTKDVAYSLEASVGAVIAESGQTLEALLAVADKAMCEEKQRRKSRVKRPQPPKD